jgi:hypothetical protein
VGEEKLSACLKEYLSSPMTLKDRFELTRKLFQESLQSVREVIASNVLTSVVAKEAAKKEGHCSTKADIEISDSGLFFLRSCKRPSTREGRKQTDLNRIRQEALNLGINVSTLGRSKKDLLEAIEKATCIASITREAEKPKTPPQVDRTMPIKPKKIKIEKKNVPEGPAAEELLAGLFDPEPDRILPEKEKPVQKVLLPKMSMLEEVEPVLKRKDLKALLHDSDAMDLDLLLEKTSPEI